MPCPPCVVSLKAKLKNNRNPSHAISPSKVLKHRRPPSSPSTAKAMELGTNIAQHLLNNVLVLLALFVADRALIVPLVAAAAPKLTSKDLTAVRWFLVHSIANAGVCLTALTSMRAVLLDPVQACLSGL